MFMRLFLWVTVICTVRFLLHQVFLLWGHLCPCRVLNSQSYLLQRGSASLNRRWPLDSTQLPLYLLSIHYAHAHCKQEQQNISHSQRWLCPIGWCGQLLSPRSCLSPSQPATAQGLQGSQARPGCWSTSFLSHSGNQMLWVSSLCLSTACLQCCPVSVKTLIFFGQGYIISPTTLS